MHMGTENRGGDKEAAGEVGVLHHGEHKHTNTPQDTKDKTHRAASFMALSLTVTAPLVPLFQGWLYRSDGCVDGVHVNVGVGTGSNLHKSTQTVRQDAAWHRD